MRIMPACTAAAYAYTHWGAWLRSASLLLNQLSLQASAIEAKMQKTPFSNSLLEESVRNPRSVFFRGTSRLRRRLLEGYVVCWLLVLFFEYIVRVSLDP